MRLLVDKCTVTAKPGARPSRTNVTIMTVSEELREEGKDTQPTIWEVLEVNISTKVYDILRDTQRARFIVGHKRSKDFDNEVLLPMNKALAELVIECGDITSRITQHGSQL